MRRKTFGRIDGLKYGWLKNAKKLIVLFVVFFLLLHLLIGISFVKGDSMEPTLHNGEAGGTGFRDGRQQRHLHGLPKLRRGRGQADQGESFVLCRAGRSARH